jgi:hypothetical protein
MPSIPSIAIVGAGCSGLAAAHSLRDSGYQVTLFEQGSRPGGRATTRQRDGFTFDAGAQYIKGGTPTSIALITERFRSDDLIDIQKPVWTFDHANHIHEGDPRQNAESKWSYRNGLITLSQLMAQSLDVRYTTRITHLEQTTMGWQLVTEAEQTFTNFTHVLVTLPAPQALELVQHSALPIDLSADVVRQLRDAHYHPLISVALGYRPRPHSRPYYALVNTDKGHPISWLAWEHEKSTARVPDGAGLLIAQMAPQYSQQHQHTPNNLLTQDVAQLVADLIDEALPAPIFSDVDNWQYALPASKADAQQINQRTIPYGLAFCGDTFVGGRVHLALDNGIMIAQQLRDHISEKPLS